MDAASGCLPRLPGRVGVTCSSTGTGARPAGLATPFPYAYRASRRGGGFTCSADPAAARLVLDTDRRVASKTRR